jgi:L-ascorbate metabolism protein UlaG (beta-lactamase superfamily)
VKFIVVGIGLLVAVIVLLGAALAIYLQHPKFGRSPEGSRLARMQRSSNFADGEFRFPIATPRLTSDDGFVSILVKNLTTSVERLRPGGRIPTVKTDLHGLDKQQDLVIWLGHSSYFIQLGGKRILVDPVLSDYGAPLPFFNRAFDGTTLYTSDDIPDIDYLLITHDHWDHLDYDAVTALEPKVGRVVAPLGLGAYFEDWGYSADRLLEGDWYDAWYLDGLKIHVMPARHYSGRTLRLNRTLWAGYVVESKERRIFLSGDSGYGDHFARIGAMFEGFDLVAMDAGQYDPRWAYVHMTPEEAVKAAQELGARRLLPGHVGRFALARHAWDEPFERIQALSDNVGYAPVIPRIGEVLCLDGDAKPHATGWWRDTDTRTTAQPASSALTTDPMRPCEPARGMSTQ